MQMHVIKETWTCSQPACQPTFVFDLPVNASITLFLYKPRLASESY
uniref:Uncharacterized protein n=1 Tax=Anguilla anguilla TaxID=7936 RepID=A0A0E9RYU3_ANGAN